MSSCNTIEKNSLPNSYEDTPFGPLNDTASRKTFSYLIGILNATYPDNDFSSFEPTDFKRINLNVLKSKFDNTLISLGRSGNNEWIWDIINIHMDLIDCIFYELIIDETNSLLDDEPGHLWTMKWFIFNKKRKRVAFLYLDGYRINSPKLHPREPKRRLTIDNDLDNEEYDLTYSDNDMKMYDEDAIEEDADGEVFGKIELS